MHPTRRAVLGAAATVSIAGCIGDGGDDGDDGSDGGDGGDDGGGMENSTDTPTGSPTATDGETATVRVRSHDDLGEILVDSEGMTLYMFDQDTRGEGASACSGDCVDAWPPLTVDDEPTRGEGVAAELETFEREDGDTQVAAGGWPLYYFASDESPGDAAGQGANDVWWVLDPDGEPVRGTPTETTDSNSGGY